MTRIKTYAADDLRLWAAYSRTLKPLSGRPRVIAPPDPPPLIAPVAPAAAPVAAPRSGWLPAIGQAPPGLDRASWQKFRVGSVRPARSLDLHGLTAARAHHAAIAFLQEAHAGRQRCVEIITGKGEVLARELPLWLEAPPLNGLVLALAYPHVGNTGAVRILLRRRR